MEKKCRVCNKKFKPKHKDQESCSAKCANIKRTRSVVERFWGKVGKSNKKGCKLWKGGVVSSRMHSANRYGQFQVGKGKRKLAHRFAFELETGKPIPKGKILQHTCGNSLCCNVEHMKLVSHSEALAGKLPKGSKHWKSKLSKRVIREIRRKYGYYGKDGLTIKELAEKYNISESTVHSIVTRKIWKWLK